MSVDDTTVELIIRPPATEWPEDRTEALRRELGACSDVAFAHLPEVLVPGRQARPNRVLFVWVVPEAMGAIRAVMNTVCDATARALPSSEFVDVVLLNSAPELLPAVEAAGSLLLERDPEERARAVATVRAATETDEAEAPPAEPDAPWWAFWRR